MLKRSVAQYTILSVESVGNAFMHSDLHNTANFGMIFPVMRMDYPKRKLTRLSEYDYSAPGTYFITICTHGKNHLFGRILTDHSTEPYMRYSAIGEIAKKHLIDMESHYDNIKIDNWVIMPNHIHLLIQITERINPFPTIHYDIPNTVGKYKAAVTRNVGNAFIHSGKLWQSSFYDHIVRNDQDYQEICRYINGNPSKWLEDCFYCE